MQTQAAACGRCVTDSDETTPGTGIKGLLWVTPTPPSPLRSLLETRVSGAGMVLPGGKRVREEKFGVWAQLSVVGWFGLENGGN